MCVCVSDVLCREEENNYVHYSVAFQMESHNALDAPPGYDSIFGGTPSTPPPSAGPPPPHLNAAVAPPSNIPGGSSHREDVPPSFRTQARGEPDDVSEHSTSCFCCKNKSAAIIGIYSFLFILGIFIPGTMIGLGGCVSL